MRTLIGKDETNIVIIYRCINEESPIKINSVESVLAFIKEKIILFHFSSIDILGKINFKPYLYLPTANPGSLFKVCKISEPLW